VKIAVSVPDELYARADEAAARLGISRSQVYARALEQFLETQGEDPVTEALNALVDGEPGSSATGRALIDAGTWEW
jgi:metal-responsive CopG/Arc/MetJ family transcriptional regulator